MVSHPGQVITQKQVAGLFTIAYNKTANIDKAINSFKSTGIWPFDPQIFQDADFSPCSVTDKPLEAADVTNNNKAYTVVEFNSSANIPINESLNNAKCIPTDNVIIVDTHGNIVKNINELPIENNAKNGRSQRLEINNINLEAVNNCVSSATESAELLLSQSSLKSIDQQCEILQVNPSDLRPLPKAQINQKRRKNNQKSEILSSTPVKEEIEKKENSSGTKRINLKRTICKNQKEKSLKKSKIESNGKETLCPSCGGRYGDPPPEDWIQCEVCEAWWHETCRII